MVGWLTGRASDLQKPVPVISIGSLPEQVEDENKGKQLLHGHLEYGH